MKNLLTSIILSTLLFASCAKKETTEPTTTVADYNFIDQPLQGLIEGIFWEINFGIINDHRFFGDDFYFYIYSASDTNHCDGMDPKTDYVSFALNELKPQLIELDFSNSVTFYDNSDSISIGAFDGAIEILSVDTINTMTITGRLDIRESSNNFVNGNFSITYCK
jgi:hypothetical protein